ncbi:melanization protease 1 [Drosophila sechellia]|nr:melanization protease 1 [Drosophila sechellia]
MTLRAMSSFIIGIAVICCLWPRVQGFQMLLEEDCGVPHRIVTRSVNTKLMENPWMAYLETSKGFHCSGTLINHLFVLTAAHCIPDDLQITVRLGEYNTKTKVDCVNHMCQEPFQEYNVDLAFRHRFYNANDQTNDIGMLRLGRRVEYLRHIRPICIFASNRFKNLIDQLTWFTTTVWRETAANASSQVLQTMNIDRQPTGTCSEIYDRNTTSEQICAGNTLSQLCSTDSGAPQMRKMWHNGSDRYVQLGIASRVKGQCQIAGIFTDLLSYADWIKRVVQQYGSSTDMNPSSRNKKWLDTMPEFYYPK